MCQRVREKSKRKGQDKREMRDMREKLEDLSQKYDESFKNQKKRTDGLTIQTWIIISGAPNGPKICTSKTFFKKRSILGSD